MIFVREQFSANEVKYLLKPFKYLLKPFAGRVFCREMVHCT